MHPKLTSDGLADLARANEQRRDSALLRATTELFVLDVIHDRGPDGLRERISQTALYGALTRGPRVVNETSRAAMQNLLEEIRSGAFAAEWRAVSAGDRAPLAALVAASRARGLARARERALGRTGGPPSTTR